MPKSRTIIGTDMADVLVGRNLSDIILARGGDDIAFGRGGNDRLSGEAGFDNLFGGYGNDVLKGGTQNDNLYGEGGNDVIHGDSGRGTLKGTDFGSDNLNGGRGRDTLYQGDGNDTMTLGGGADTVFFKWQDPMIALAVATGRSFTTLTDFDPDEDRFVFDVAGLGSDVVGANFIDGGAGDGTPGGKAASFFKGATEGTNGESVMILTDKGFETGAQAVLEANGEQPGDFIIYFNTTLNVGSLLFVDPAPVPVPGSTETDTAHSIARFANIDSLSDLQNADFTANDFLFA